MRISDALNFNVAGPTPRSGRVFAGACVLAMGLSIFAGGCGRDHRVTDIPPLPATVAAQGKLSSALVLADNAVKRNPTVTTARLQLARLYLANGFIEQARICLLPLGTDTKTGARACYYLAQIADSASDQAARMGWLKDTLRMESNYVPARILVADIHAKTGEALTAATEYETVTRIASDSPEALIGLARVRLQAGDKIAAEMLLNDLLKQHPGSCTGLTLLSRLVEDKGDVAQAEHLREQARRFKDPPMTDPWMDEVMAVCYDLQKLSMRFEDFVKSGRSDQALTCLRQMESVDSDNWIVCQMRALAAIQQGRLDQAVHEYERALKAGGDIMQIYPALINGLMALGRTSEAEAMATAGLKAAPSAPAILVAAAELHLKLHDSNSARELLLKALKLEPQHPGANRQMALLCWTDNQPDQALPYLRAARQLLPADVPVRVLLAQYHLERNEPQEALPLLHEALAVEPTNTEIKEAFALTHLRMGNQAARAGRLSEALNNYNTAIAAQPEFAEAYANKVQLCLQQQDFATAETAMLQLAALRPDNAAIFSSLGDIQDSAGKRSAATESWRRAIELLGDKDSELRAALAARLQSGPSP